MSDTIDYMKPENRFRATPLDLLKQGLLTQNWEAVKLCYTMLTGEVISETAPVKQAEPEPVKHKRGRPKKVIEAAKEVAASVPTAASGVTREDIPAFARNFEGCVAPAKSKEVNGKIYTRATMHDCSPHPNTWTDDGYIATAEIVKDRQVPVSVLQSQRPSVPEIKVRCASCGKSEVVEPGLVPYGLRLTKRYTMNYRCNDCIVGVRPALEFENVASDELFED